MGYYTTVFNASGEEVQIRTGDDGFEEYHIGDTVNWTVNPNSYDCVALLDGVYEGYADSGTWWVIIKDHKIANVVPAPELTEDDDPFEQRCAFEQSLIERYDVKVLKGDEYRALFTSEALARHDALMEKINREHEEFMASIAHLPPQEQFIKTIARAVMPALNYQSIGRALLGESVPDPDLQVRPYML